MSRMITDRFERDLQRRHEDRIAVPLFAGWTARVRRAVQRPGRRPARERAEREPAEREPAAATPRGRAPAPAYGPGGRAGR